MLSLLLPFKLKEKSTLMFFGGKNCIELHII